MLLMVATLLLAPTVESGPVGLVRVDSPGRLAGTVREREGAGRVSQRLVQGARAVYPQGDAVFEEGAVRTHGICDYDVTPLIWPKDGRSYDDVLPERRKRYPHNAALMDRCNDVLAKTWVHDYEVHLEVGLAAHGFLKLTICGGANALGWYDRAWHGHGAVSPTFKGRNWEKRMLEWLRWWGMFMHFVIRDAQDRQ